MEQKNHAVWIIDDQEEFCRAFIDYCESRRIDSRLTFAWFPTARSALEEMERLKKSIRPREYPRVILLDGHLLKDEGELQNGFQVVPKLKHASGSSLPTIVGWSADPFANEDMVKAGAVLAFSKSRPRDVLSFLSSHEKYGAN